MPMSSRRLVVRIVLIAVALAAAVGAAPRNADAQAARAVGATPPRLAFIDGEVSFWRTGAEDWTPAQVNTALAAGDDLYAPDGANLEIEIGARAFVRAGSDTQLGIASLETGFLQLEVTSGHSAVDVKDLPAGQEIEIDTPSGAFIVDRPGYYRVDVGDDGTTFTTHRGGVATMIPAGGERSDVPADQQVVLAGTETARVAISAAPAEDAWDRWNYDRTGGRPERPRSAQYVPPALAGVDDLDAYGDWDDEPQYGHVWIPRDTPADWAPYSTGRWVWDPYYEWTWVDDAPWGWAPYHYGRWCRVRDRWGWAPGPVVVAPVYAPALVAFFGSRHGGVSVSVGMPGLSWVALGFGEPVLPWWGPPAFVGRPYWGGWGGRRYVNNVVVSNTTIVNVRNITRFQNSEVRNAVIGVDRDHFGRGRGNQIRLAPDRARDLTIVRGQLGVKPVATSLSPREGRGRRPSEQVQRRGVVATRPPQNVAPRLRAAGLQPDHAARPDQPPRILPPQARQRGSRDRGAEGAREGQGVAPGAVAPGAIGEDRARGKDRGRPDVGHGPNEPPPPPGRENHDVRKEPGRGNDRGRIEVPPPVDDRGNARPNDRRGRDEAKPVSPGDERGNARHPERATGEHGRPEAPQPAAPPAPPEERGNRRERGRGEIGGGKPPEPPPPAPQIQERPDTRNRGRDRGGEGRGRQAVPPPAAPPVMEEHGNPRSRERGIQSRERQAPPAPERPTRERRPDVEQRRPAMPPPQQHNDAPERMNRGGSGGDGAAPRIDRAEHQRERQMERAAPPPKVEKPPPREAPNDHPKHGPRDRNDHGGPGE